VTGARTWPGWPRANGADLGRRGETTYLDEQDVPKVADALDQVTQPWFRERYFRLAGHGYAGTVSEEYFDYTWHWFELMRGFFRKTADEGREMVFTAPQ
jgi:hypothetical protein